MTLQSLLSLLILIIIPESYPKRRFGYLLHTCFIPTKASKFCFVAPEREKKQGGPHHSVPTTRLLAPRETPLQNVLTPAARVLRVGPETPAERGLVTWMAAILQLDMEFLGLPMAG